MASAKKSTAKKPAAKKAAAKKSATKKPAAKKASAKAPAKKATTKKATTKTANKATTTTAKKATTKKASVKKAATKKSNAPKKAKSPFDKKFLDEQKDLLLAERSRYLQSAETLLAEAEALIEGREPGDVQFDEEGGEGDTLAVERERDLALSAHAQKAVDEIDAALDRLKDGTYGICVVSGKNIPKERLRAIPWAAERVEYKAGGFGTRR